MQKKAEPLDNSILTSENIMMTESQCSSVVLSWWVGRDNTDGLITDNRLEVICDLLGSGARGPH